jgi:hypothetical protein
MNNWTNKILWGVYLCLLGVLLPHTAWAFSTFEPQDAWWGKLTAWLGALAFEAAIAVLTHKLAKHIETVRRGKRIFARRYLNAYSFGLLVAIGVSMLANLSHAVEFGGTMAIFGSGSVLPAVYSVAFGAILPVVSLLFARVLSNVVDTEGEPDPELAKANETIKEFRKDNRDLRQANEKLSALLDTTEQKLVEAETKFAAAGELFARLMAGSKRDRIMAASEQWPALKPSAIAVLTESSPAYVSEVLNDSNGSERTDNG